MLFLTLTQLIPWNRDVLREKINDTFILVAVSASLSSIMLSPVLSETYLAPYSDNLVVL